MRLLTFNCILRTQLVYKTASTTLAPIRGCPGQGACGVSVGRRAAICATPRLSVVCFNRCVLCGVGGSIDGVERTHAAVAVVMHQCDGTHAQLVPRSGAATLLPLVPSNCCCADPSPIHLTHAHADTPSRLKLCAPSTCTQFRALVTRAIH